MQNGNEYLFLDSFIECKIFDKAVQLRDCTAVQHEGKIIHQNIYHWIEQMLPVEGTLTSWKKLSDLEESHPVIMAEYALTQGIRHLHLVDVVPQEERQN